MKRKASVDQPQVAKKPKVSANNEDIDRHTNKVIPQWMEQYTLLGTSESIGYLQYR